MSLERRGRAEFDSFDREVRQGRYDKTFHHTARTEAKDILRFSHQSGRAFRSIPAGHFARFRPPFRSIPATPWRG